MKDQKATLRLATAFLAAAILIALLFPGCGNNSGKTKETPRSEGDRYGGTYRLNILRGDPKGLDPVLVNSKHADDIASQVFDHLIDLDPKLELIPELARALPAISSDGRIYRFNLRTDVFFHDDISFPDGKGRRFTAQDVKYSLTRCCDPRTQTVAFWAFQDKVKGATEYFESINSGQPLDGIPGFQVIDDSTFQIELIRPYAPFIYYLVNALGDIVPHEAVEHYGADFFRNPVGTGPFRFDHWRHNEELVLVRNPHYWGKDAGGQKLPYLDTIHYTFIKDDKVQFREFTAGNLDEVYGIPTENFPDVIDTATRLGTPAYQKYQVQAVPAMLTWFFDFNCQKAPFDNPDVRRAFNYAVDRERLVRYVLQNSPYAPALHGLVPPVFPGYATDSIRGYQFDETRAKELLAKAGYPDGKGFPPVTLHIYPEPRLQQVTEALQAMLARTLNVTVSIQTLDFPQLMDQSERGQLQFWGTRWYGDYPDPETFLNLMYGALVPKSDTLPSYPNSTRYNGTQFNALFAKGVRTIDAVARNKYYGDAEQSAIDDAPMIPLFYEMHYRLLQPGIQNNPLDAMARYDLKYVWMKSGGESVALR
jgi:peptide/nickel transport system substrate-binding protein